MQTRQCQATEVANGTETMMRLQPTLEEDHHDEVDHEQREEEREEINPTVVPSPARAVRITTRLPALRSW